MSRTSRKDVLLRELANLWRNGIFRTVFLLLLVVAGNFALQTGWALVLKTEYPLCYTPISGSMEPTLKVGDLLIIQGGLSAVDIRANPSDGDILIFRNPNDPSGIPIVHRAIEKTQKSGTWYFTTKGDANPSRDNWLVPESYLLGKVIFSVPLLGSVLRLLDETGIYIDGYGITLRTAIIISLVAAIFFLELMSPSEASEKAEENEKKQAATPQG